MLDHEQMQKIHDEETRDLSDYERAPVLDLTDGDQIPADEDDLTKQALLKQHHADHFGGDDLAGMTDDEAFAAMPKPWRADG